ncbi:hypothetical protein B0T26DRAFT_637106 [Lasiosphaeria miniovina]|uniref:C2 domain-containing protein n=1 Tax=Lasiosphaeria miniovina TaxID=1954250 RepID=A0AA40B3F5_9PEZI|nr:uncharacterized protein B0T26DRAFT_637106 [Lasiosphaeria miniovina]KAK0726955.1 hypothetical protein B0T26DRAFT_637106 [Lasiosphaeria miniovina]
MASKTKGHPLNGMHTAGIFSDMTVDGPQIGTLVLVVDRAKNLPNLRTIGKQDPYCAARLGKEAKKTTTDIRGGQVPKWDQELRFTVHDSPDYYQLKVSVFNDDKKTELIGEAWIDLRDIIISGGGQSDQWHQLFCRGKKTGEIRIEITFYDSRPKPERAAVVAKQPGPAADAEAAQSAAGPRSMPKRRPLPLDPVTGQAPPSPSPEPVETPTRPQPSPSHLPSQSPLQQLEYNTPPPGAAGASAARYQQQPDFPQYRTPDRSDRYASHAEDRDYNPHQEQPPYDRYDSRPHDAHYMPPDDRARPAEDDRPPPPPAHRTRTGSNGAMNATYQGGFDPLAKGTPPTMRHDVLRNEAHRHSASASYPGRPTYKAYDSAPAGMGGAQYSDTEQPSPPRHHSYDSSYDPSHRTMQATVEDVPESPDTAPSFRRSMPGLPHAQSYPSALRSDFDHSVSPAPLAVGPRGGAGPRRISNAPNVPDQQRYQGSSGYMTSASDVSDPGYPGPRDLSRHSESSLVSYGSHGDQRALTYRSELDDTSNGYGMPPVPPSLVPGIDPNIASKGIVERYQPEKNHERRYTQPASFDTPPRGRPMGDVPRRYDQDTSPRSYNAGLPPNSRSPVMYSEGPSTSSVNVVIKSRAYSPNPIRDPSPNPNHTIRRKSVSPAPPPAESRRLSAVPFGPDSYNALNPTVASAATREPAITRPDYDESRGKIITHDGREVDPSDHLPMETWAPEPEPKKPKAPTSSAPASARPSPSGAQPLPLAGRRPLRVAGRPQSVLPSGVSSAQYALSGPVEPETPSPPTSTGRNRLQKKAQRSPMTAAGPVMSGANGPGGFRSGSNSIDSSPLAPYPPHQDNNNYTPTRQLARASTFDSYGGGGGSSENYPPPVMYNGGGGNRGPPPPLPAKVPLALPAPPLQYPPAPVMSGALQLHSSSLARRGSMDDRYQGGYDDGDYDGRGGDGDVRAGGGHGSSLSLEEEMQRIDLGPGRSRRRRY